MLGEIIYSQASEFNSNYAMRHLYEKVAWIKFNKRQEHIKQIILDHMSRGYVSIGDEKYEVEFGEVRHANGIGNNNEWDTFLVNEKEKCFVGSVFVLWPIFGDTCEVSVKNIKGERLNV